MNCAECGSEIVFYCLEQRSSRLYLYLCESCMSAFLAHHFDLDLECYGLGELEVKRRGGLFFVQGLEFDPRVFDFELDGKEEVLLVLDSDYALGELALGKKRTFAPCSERAKKRLQRHLGCSKECAEGCSPEYLAEKVEELWKAAGGG